MKPDVKTLWLKALRDGSYKQGRRALRADDTYCCLGVLCDLYRQENKLGMWISAAGLSSFVQDGESNKAFPINSVARWAGLEKSDPMVPNPCLDSKEPLFSVDPVTSFYTYDELLEKDRLNLSTLNDSGASFSLIADIIEKNL